MKTPTIFALASGAGHAAVAVIRLSGPGTAAALRALTGRALPPPRRARLASLRDPVGGEVLDKGLVLWLPGPASFTGEDMAELHIHGGPAVIAGVIEALAALPGLRPAEPGAFTRRAFDNGKLDLTEAEAIADLVDAETGAQRRQALRQMAGELGRLIEGWRERLMRALAHLEAGIDFVDEDLPAGTIEAVTPEILGVRDEITRHLDDRNRGERLRDGFYIAVLGPPNAGKSRLVNRLARREAAIVSAMAGTTRDVIEVHLDLGGYPVIMADTAGLRAAAGGPCDDVEREGIRRARARAAAADLKVVVVEAPRWPEIDAAVVGLIDGDTLVVVNKVDLARPRPDPALGLPQPLPQPSAGGGRPGPEAVAGPAAAEGQTGPEGQTGSEGQTGLAGPIAVLPISAATGEGLDALFNLLEREVGRRLGAAGGAAPAVTRARHRRALEDCRDALDRFGAAPASELAAEDLRLAVRALGRITGRVDVEAILDLIFREFCIGK